MLNNRILVFATKVFILSFIFLDSNFIKVSASRPASTIPEAQKAVFDILSSEAYSKAVRPSPGNSTNATVINVNMFVRKIDRIDDLQMSLTLQLTLRQVWVDPRLRYDVDTHLIEYVTLDDVSSSSSPELWTPDLFFGNEASAFVHSIMKPNSYKRVFPDGNVMWSTRLTCTFSCPMDLRYFPFDNQVCTVRMESYSLSRRDLIIRWMNVTPVTFMDPRHKRYSKFDLQKSETGSCDPDNVALVTGKFSCIFLNMFLQRQSGVYVTLVYMPTSMCVWLSWISFWLGQAISARLSLTLTLLLTMATQTQGMNQGLPQVSYTKAIDVWTGTCLSFGALAILETAVAAYLLQQKQNNVGTLAQDKMMEQPAFKPRKTLMLDKVSRILFPAGFAMFTLGYVLAYVVGDNYPSMVVGGYENKD